MLVVVTAGCLLAMVYLSQDRTVGWLLTAGLVVGSAIAMVGIVHVLRSNGKLLWVVPFTQGGGSPFGPFVNRNNAGGFLNLCLACGVGLVAWVHNVRFARDSVDIGGRFVARPAPSSRAAVQRWLAELDGDRVMVWAGVLLVGAAVMASLSRGSCLAMTAATAVTVGAARWWSGKRVPWWASVLLVMGAIWMVIWLGQMGLLLERFDQGKIQADMEYGRLSNWQEALQAWPGFWSWGSGLETWRYVYRPFEITAAGTHVHLHAENQFVQTLTDAGVVGLALLLAAVAVTAWSIHRLARVGDRVSSALAVTGTFALVSQAVGGSLDFGLYLPANALLMALICGAVCGRDGVIKWRVASGERRVTDGGRCDDWQDHATTRPGLEQSAKTDPPTHPVSRNSQLATRNSFPTDRPIHRLIFGLLAVGTLLAAWEFYQFARVQRLTSPVVMRAMDEVRDDATLKAEIVKLNAATRYRMDDATAQHAIARLWLQRFRLQAASQLQQAQPWVEPQGLWQRSSPIALLAVNRQLGIGHEGGRTAVVRDLEVGRPILEACRFHAERAVRSCPWDGRYQLTLATVMQLMGERDETAVVLQRVRWFAGGNPELWYRSGLLDLLAGRESVASDTWQRCLQLDPGYAKRIATWE